MEHGDAAGASVLQSADQALQILIESVVLIGSLLRVGIQVVVVGVGLCQAADFRGPVAQSHQVFVEVLVNESFLLFPGDDRDGHAAVLIGIGRTGLVHQLHRELENVAGRSGAVVVKGAPVQRNGALFYGGTGQRDDGIEAGGEIPIFGAVKEHLADVVVNGIAGAGAGGIIILLTGSFRRHKVGELGYIVCGKQGLLCVGQAVVGAAGAVDLAGLHLQLGVVGGVSLTVGRQSLNQRSHCIGGGLIRLTGGGSRRGGSGWDSGRVCCRDSCRCRRSTARGGRVAVGGKGCDAAQGESQGHREPQGENFLQVQVHHSVPLFQVIFISPAVYGGRW